MRRVNLFALVGLFVHAVPAATVVSAQAVSRADSLAEFTRARLRTSREPARRFPSVATCYSLADLDTTNSFARALRRGPFAPPTRSDTLEIKHLLRADLRILADSAIVTLDVATQSYPLTDSMYIARTAWLLRLTNTGWQLQGSAPLRSARVSVPPRPPNLAHCLA